MHNRAALLASILVLLPAVIGPLGCAQRISAERPPQAPVPESPWSPVAAPVPAMPPRPAATPIPLEFMENISALTLAEVIDLALRNNTVTRGSWAEARAAAAEVGSRRSSYYPEIDLEGSVASVQQAIGGGQVTFQKTFYGPSLSINYMLLDFGGRAGEVDKARHALIAADWAHNSAIQNVVLQVQEAYFGYLNAKAQLAAAEAGVREAQENLAAATTRHDAGVATIAEVLQARTSLSQAELSRVVVEGQIDILLGALATSMGLPANTRLDVGALPSEPPVEQVTGAVDDIIESALAARPDLAAARARALEAESEIRVARSKGLPTLNLAAAADRTYYSGGGNDDNWSAGILFSYPIFNGFQRKYDLRKAEEEAAVALARAEELEQEVVLDVWTSHREMRTAGKRILASRDLLASAEQNEQVALGRYKEGVGSMLDLLTAQALLASARAEEIQARSDWFIAMARLAHATGSLGPSPENSPRSDGGNSLETP